MAPREVGALRAQLATIEKAARAIAAQVEDLHALAYDRPARDEVKVAGGTTAELDSVGDARARQLCGRLVRELEAVEKQMVALKQAVGNRLSEGPSPPVTRGSQVSRGAFDRALVRQRHRLESGEYTPHRTAEQPRYPGGKA